MHNKDSSPTLTQVTFTGNRAYTGGGGGMYNQESAAVLSQATFTGNSAGTQYGGGMFNTASSPTLTRVAFTGNTAGLGGGLYNVAASAPAIAHGTFNGNKADMGGAIYNDASTPLLAHLTFTGNQADTTGGAIYNAASAASVLVNSILWGNEAPSLAQYAGGGGIHYSIVQGRQTDTAVVTAVVDAGDSNPLNGDSVADNGGSVQTIALTPSRGSYSNPAINAGLYLKRAGSRYYSSSDGSTWYSGLSGSSSLTTPAADAVDLTATDARGYARVGRPDLGAFEDGAAP
jgi:predicted outer membrane repeat protein